MKRLLAVTNALLAVIAVCLCLLVLRLYDFELVPTAHADVGDGPMPVRVVNDQLPCKVEGPVDARMHYEGYGWTPVRGEHGALLVKAPE